MRKVAGRASCEPAEALVTIAAAFVKAQELRHRADYDLATTADFSLEEVATLIDKIEAAIAGWRGIRQDRAVRLYLTSLLAWDKMRK